MNREETVLLLSISLNHRTLPDFTVDAAKPRPNCRDRASLDMARHLDVAAIRVQVLDREHAQTRFELSLWLMRQTIMLVIFFGMSAAVLISYRLTGLWHLE